MNYSLGNSRGLYDCYSCRLAKEEEEAQLYNRVIMSFIITISRASESWGAKIANKLLCYSKEGKINNINPSIRTSVLQGRTFPL